jgi:hypothetical protein
MSPEKSKAAMRFALWIVFAGIVVMFLRGVRAEKYRDQKVAGGDIMRPLDFLAAHSSSPRYLIVGGHTYRGVRGSPPYYLDVPALNSILFVTGAVGGDTTFHLVNLMTKEHIEFDGGTSGFGGMIGANRKPGDPFTDYVESASSNKVILSKHTSGWMERTVLNLETKSAERGGTVSFDANGVQTNR